MCKKCEHKRDKEAKESYRFLDRFLRTYADEIIEEHDMIAKDLFLYGIHISRDGKRIEPKDFYKDGNVSSN